MAKRIIEITNNPDMRPRDLALPNAFQEALGYLSLWAYESESYGYVRIYANSRGDLFADYWKDRDAFERRERCGYALMGQRDAEGAYTFHS